MIYIVNRDIDTSSTQRFIKRFDLGDRLKILHYERLFATRLAPIGHYIFCEFDRLRPYERIVAEQVARAVGAVAPGMRVLNRPALVRERYALLRALADAGVNSFDAMRLEDGRRPARYPVFLRREDEYFGAESELIHSDEEFDAAVAALEVRGVSVRGFLAVGWCAERGADGRYRKYGVMRVGDYLIPAHIHFGPHWVVKRTIGPMTPQDVTEELSFVRDNPHHQVIMRAFDLARMEFGRVDYGVVNGRVEIYEINSNPVMPTGGRNPERAERTAIVADLMRRTFTEIDSVKLPRGRVTFDLPQPMMRPFPGEKLGERLQVRAAHLLHRLGRRVGL